MACDFYHTGKLGLLGSLSAGQIVGQYVVARRVAKEGGMEEGEEERPIFRIVFMEMGEHFDNYEEVMKVGLGGEGGREGGREGGKEGRVDRRQREDLSARRSVKIFQMQKQSFKPHPPLPPSLPPSLL